MSSPDKSCQSGKSKINEHSFLVHFCAGALGASASEILTLPFDTAKVRMMLHGMSGKYSNIFKSVKTIQNEEGVSKLWKGYKSAIARQFVFTGLKLAIYDPFKHFLVSNEEEKKNTPILKKILASVVSGGVSAFFSSPFDLVKIRMQDTKTSQKCNGTIDCYRQIYLKEGGIKGFFAGSMPNIFRNSLMTAAELTGYDTTRQFILNNTSLEDQPALYLLYGLMAGLTGTALAQPIDLVKTRVMNDPKKYKNAFTCFKKIIAEDGFLALYKGLKPFMFRE